MKQTDYFSVKLENEKIICLDQTKLPVEEVYITTDNYERIAEAIERLEHLSLIPGPWPLV